MLIFCISLFLSVFCKHVHAHTVRTHTHQIWQPAANYALRFRFSNRLPLSIGTDISCVIRQVCKVSSETWGSHQPSDVMSVVWPPGSTGLTRVRTRLQARLTCLMVTSRTRLEEQCMSWSKCSGGQKLEALISVKGESSLSHLQWQSLTCQHGKNKICNKHIYPVVWTILNNFDIFFFPIIHRWIFTFPVQICGRDSRPERQQQDEPLWHQWERVTDCLSVCGWSIVSNTFNICPPDYICVTSP